MTFSGTMKVPAGLLIVLASSWVAAQSPDAPHPKDNPLSPLMLSGTWMPKDTHRIDSLQLPKVPGQHSVVSDVREAKGVNQHNYLIHYRDRYYVMWSDGPGIEDQVGQRVKFASSIDGVDWSEPQFMTPIPPNSGPDSPFYGKRTNKGLRWIARGFWERDGDLLALATLDEADGFFGPSLELHAFQLDVDAGTWSDAGVIADNAINNFPPKKIPTGEWMMSRRPFNYYKTGVQFLVGGVKSIDDWQSFPVLETSSELSAEEPLWWVLPDGNLMALFRDNRFSKFLYRAFSTDAGRTWSKPVRTNFPDATSKLHGLRLSDGRYVLVSNSNPQKRDPLTLAISKDGIVFDELYYLVGGRHVDYPYVMEHDGHLLVAFAGGKQSVEVLKIEIAELNKLRMPESVKPMTTYALKPDVAPDSADWIDLGEEGQTLYLACEFTVPQRGQRTHLALATSTGEIRISAGINALGELTSNVYQSVATGKALPAGTQLSLLMRVVSHSKTPDQVFLNVGPAGTVPEEPQSDDAWMLINSKGSSDANLSTLIGQGPEDDTPIRNVRIATTRAGVTSSKP